MVSIVRYTQGDEIGAMYLWFLSIILIISAFISFRCSIPKRIPLLLFLIVILAIGLRLPYLASIPYAVHGDEAFIGIEARQIIQSARPFNMFQIGWYDYLKLTFLLAAIPMKLFGPSLFAIRFSSGMLGIGSIIITYVLVSMYRNRKEAVIASFLLAVAHLHIHFSRTGFQYMQGLFFSELAIFFFLAGIKKKHLLWFTLSGLFTGLGFHVYLSARITILILLSSILWHKIRFGIWETDKRSVSIFLLSFLIGIGPILYKPFIWSNTRSSEVFLLNKTNEITHSPVTNWIPTLVKQTASTFSFFITGKDTSLQYGIAHPGVDLITGFFVFLGIALWIQSIFRKNQATHDQTPSLFFTSMGIWFFFILIIGGILTIDPPFYPRLLLILIPCVIFAAYGYVTVIEQHIPNNRKNIVTLCVLSTIGLINGLLYFKIYTPSIENGETTAITKLAYTIQNHTVENFVLIKTPPSFDLGHPTIQFLSPNIYGTTKQTLQDSDLSGETLQSFQYLSYKENLSTMIIVAADDPNLNQIQLLYPRHIWHIIPQRDKLLFYYIVLPKKTLK